MSEHTQALPRHVAIIMDGNGRWAKKRMMPRTVGHRAGMKALHTVVEAASDLGIEVLTVYAFSTENWKRSAEEVGALMDLAVEYFFKELDELCAKNVRVRVIGIREGVPEKVAQAARAIEEKTAGNTGLVLNVAFNYGGRADVVQAVQQLIARGAAPEDITEESISAALYTGGLPDPDIVVRTGGEKRLSNFMLWQNSYAELMFEDILWPDCGRKFLEDVIAVYQGRDRRYGDAQ